MFPLDGIRQKAELILSPRSSRVSYLNNQRGISPIYDSMLRLLKRAMGQEVIRKGVAGKDCHIKKFTSIQQYQKQQAMQQALKEQQKINQLKFKQKQLNDLLNENITISPSQNNLPRKNSSSPYSTDNHATPLNGQPNSPHMENSQQNSSRFSPYNWHQTQIQYEGSVDAGPFQNAGQISDTSRTVDVRRLGQESRTQEQQQPPLPQQQQDYHHHQRVFMSSKQPLSRATPSKL